MKVKFNVRSFKNCTMNISNEHKDENKIDSIYTLRLGNEKRDNKSLYIYVLHTENVMLVQKDFIDNVHSLVLIKQSSLVAPLYNIQ